MLTFPTMTWRGRTAGAVLGAVAGLAALSGTALAAQATPAPGTNLLVNGTFAKPGPAKHEGATPTGWKLVDLGAETKPFNASIGAYNAKGMFPPPMGNPNKQDIAVEAFYEAGTATGVEGIGGEQTSATFGSVTQANNPQVSFSDLENKAPETMLAKWAGGGLEIDFTHAKKSFSLIYLNPWTPPAGKYASKPVNSATTKYIFGPTLKLDKWNTQQARSLNADVKQQFKLTSYKVTDVRFIDLEDTTSAASPFPNMDGYVANVALNEGS
jgi:hypothetical protein